jgi:hypothetical protein
LENALPLRSERGDAARDHLDRTNAGGRERIAELLVTGQPAPQPARGCE